MNIQALSNPRFLKRTKRRADSKLESVEAVYLLEQFTGPVPLRTERPAAEVLAERLAEADLAIVSPSFIP